MNDHPLSSGTSFLFPGSGRINQRPISSQVLFVTPTEADVIRQIEPALSKNLAFLGSGQPRETWNEVQGLKEDFRTHLGWMMNLGNVQDTFSRFAVPNYIVRVVYPLSQSLRLDFLLGKVPECFMEVRALLEQLARSFQADLRFPKEKLFASKLARLDALEPKLSKLVEEMDATAFSFWTELASCWVRTDQPLTGQMSSLPVSAAPVAYTPRDLPLVVRLGDSVRRFRELLSRMTERWKAKPDK